MLTTDEFRCLILESVRTMELLIRTNVYIKRVNKSNTYIKQFKTLILYTYNIKLVSRSS